MLYDHLGRPLRPGKLAEGEYERHDVQVDEITGEISRITSYDTAIVMQQADAELSLGNNGFTKGRGQRVIGEMPFIEYLEMCRVAEESGDNVTGTDLKKYLMKNREYMTVPRIDTGRKGQIIIK